MRRSLAWIGAAAAMAALLTLLALFGGRLHLRDGFYAPTEALCRTGPTAIDRSLIRPWVGRAANVQKLAYSGAYPDRLIIDNSEVCFLVSRQKQGKHLECSYGGNAEEGWRYTYSESGGAIFLDRREFRYCGPIPGAE
ncbi:hypothetical protein [Inquilinus limosus]|uniref:Uncharacterized protein n=1 Tax=Inquilinus limosus MP06 TaxID=1398085 RepID=A0A0A0D9F5_9PROT|nr:hypothetical protein [Inquilinus limosus]KGM34759.1 hypothetical protein P409_08485 [Inquilinus limosus MP06]